MKHIISNKIYNGHRLYRDYDPYNPLNLPPNTVRVRTSDGNVPIKIDSGASYTNATLVDGTTDVYDVYKSGDLSKLLYLSTNVIEVLGANTKGITNMNQMLAYCTSLTSVPLFDTSKVMYMTSMFEQCRVLPSIPLYDTSSLLHINYTFFGCNALTSIPLFNTSKITNMASTFYNCTNVRSGALALYQQASTQTIPPKNHTSTFHSCGSNTTTGSAELEQIPDDWK